ncbi:MarR family winged helix-turn-helix transcriptional regulator [Niveispirillum sp. KHB5.9]|uniref:MarR family winged helix-turn-helix transcriptional regulator n=1 Tax=Niveispirillum sp. KHB5.9 TaxID=3400269 RepID=UPI003A8489E9
MNTNPPNPPSWPAPLPDRIGDGLARITAVLRSQEWDAATRLELTPTQLNILGFLAVRGDAGVKVKEVAAELGVSQPTATDSINALERKGHVAKVTGAGDRRSVLVRIAPSGRDLLRQAEAMPNPTQDAIAALAPPAQEEMLMMLVGVIRHLQEAGAIPIQRMCATCRHFRPFAHDDADRPHHCAFVDAAFGRRDFRVECADHVTADPATRAATWAAFHKG